MPAKKAKIPSSRRTPAAKRWLHTFYLVQPVLQFLAIVIMVLAFTRCSPLAPSTLKEGAQAVKTQPSENASQNAEAQAREEAIQKSLKEVDQAPLQISAEEDVTDFSKSVPHLETPADEATIKNIFAKRKALLAHNRPKILFIALSDEQRTAFFQEGSLRLDLTEKLRFVEKAKNTFLQNMHKTVNAKEVGASLHIVLPDATMQRVNGAFNDLEIQIKVSLGLPTEDKLYLQLEKMPEDAAHAQDNAVLLDAALQEALGFVILLE
jgi:hypothetical protein